MTQHYNYESRRYIEGLNKHIETKRSERGIENVGHMVLQKEIIPHSSFKVYKIYRYTLWFTKRGKSYRVITVQHTAKVPDGQEENMLREMNIMLSTLIFNWIGSDFYEAVIKGEYNGVSENTNE